MTRGWNSRVKVKHLFTEKGDDYFGPSDYANKLLTAMYDFADERRIWIE